MRNAWQLVLVALLGGCGGSGGGGDADADADSDSDTLHCGPPTVPCGEFCRDLTLDPNNCGECGATCPQGIACVDSACEETCPEGLVSCGDTCIDTTTNPDHCGDCDAPCVAGELCRDGACLVNCPGDQTDCNGECFDLQADPTHCGDCATACAGGEVCNAGVCDLSCGGGLTECGGACVDTQTNSAHCGGCDQPCAGDESCEAGACLGTGCSAGADATQNFGDDMVGCAGTVAHADRATLCSAGFHVCSAADWVANHGDTEPVYTYYVDEALNYEGDAASCWVDEVSGNACLSVWAPNGPCGVCAGTEDPLGNTCVWANCGYHDAPPPNHYFGGCTSANTAGALCCRD